MKDIKYYQGSDLTSPVRPQRPTDYTDNALSKLSAQEVKEHFAKKADYVIQKQEYDKKVKHYRMLVSERSLEFQRDLAADLVGPLSYDQTLLVAQKAWEDAHSDGFESVVHRADELAEFVDKVVNA